MTSAQRKKVLTAYENGATVRAAAAAAGVGYYAARYFIRKWEREPITYGDVMRRSEPQYTSGFIAPAAPEVVVPPPPRGFLRRLVDVLRSVTS